MKILFATALFAVILLACSSEPAGKKNSSEKAKEIFAVDHPDYAPGLALVEKSDCLSCHKVNEISTGPSYVAIAEKYENSPENVTLLSDKILKGGQGIWGQVPMLAHPTLTKSEAETMVKYILLLKP